jgi:hypothetical protein
VTAVPLVFVVGAAQTRVAVPVVAATVTVADCTAEPPVPVHVSVYLAVAASAAVFCEPLAASEPLQPPVAAQEVALAEVQVKVDAAPLATVLGLALRLTVGAGVVTVTVVDCAALPPLPVQVRV